MSYKIAVGSGDGVYVDQHFATALQFFIFEVKDKDYNFIETRKNITNCPCSDFHKNKFKPLIEKISDCRALLIGKIGPGAENIVRSHGIDVYDIHEAIDVALEKLIQYYERQA
ncbi:NifB/NifX family molybdenum-iron cluster-binding protein [Clostridium felsineum]|uniref:NifB/NifX family molybdenum-iron cluster-binding protein n=1 Tax=Clostridium felsineum TaxID=36839 RepID=UPI00098C0B57|nr:NifB/NifX family molybdenum-iron cluster-binding protein [Clostridium felsineum]URZ18408.1 FeMo cofactor biosynthesis protein NifB [Clostridium felsineum DSM 794]